MIDRLQAFLDRPLDPTVARTVLAIASVVTIGFSVLVGWGSLSGPSPEDRPSAAAVRPTAPPATPATRPAEPASRPEPAPRHPRQDPQDRRGTPASARAERSLRSHRILQHLPYSSGRLSVTLVGADHGRAVLRVEASSAKTARQGWRHLLRRFGDVGRSYLPRFLGRSRKGDAGAVSRVGRGR